MTQRSENQSNPIDRASVTDLFRRYLDSQATAQAAGLGFVAAVGEVEPFDAGPMQPVDPQLAWQGALKAGELLGPTAESWSVPTEWPDLVAAQEPAVALAFCLGNFPQLVRDVQPLLRQTDRAKLRPKPGQPLTMPALLDWANQPGDPARTLLAAGVLRLARHFDAASALLGKIKDKPWHVLRDNEQAALAWHRGDADKAAELWNRMPESVPVLFNRGMSALFLGRSAEAEPLLTRAVEQLPDGDAWHHLGLLYRTMAGV